MKRRVYQTLNGGEVVALRPENELDLAALEANANDSEAPELDARHSLGDEREGEEELEEADPA